MKFQLPFPRISPLIPILGGAFILAVSLVIYYLYSNYKLNSDLSSLSKSKSELQKNLNSTILGFEALKNTDQIKRNETLQAEINNIKKTYSDSLKTYEDLIDLSDSKTKVKFSESFAKILKYLSETNYASASSTLTTLNKDIEAEKNKVVQSFKIPDNVPASNTPPSSGFSRQSVQTENGSFLVNIISADLGSTRVIVDTASDSDCRDNCPVLSLGDYVGRNGAFAGINGSFFCPATYPSCAGKTNSFDILLMNKNKKYFNSDNNVYSTVPAVIFSGGSIRFVSRSQEWGRDTSADGVIANYPLYLVGGNSMFSGSSDPKINSKGTRTFVGNKDNTVYIGVVYNASASDMASVLKTLGLQNALGMDQGGSTALWYGGYKAGPGRGIPNAILFIKK